MDLLSSKASIEAYNRFVKRLEGDDRLSAILDDDEVAAEEILYLPQTNVERLKRLELEIF